MDLPVIRTSDGGDLEELLASVDQQEEERQEDPSSSALSSDEDDGDLVIEEEELLASVDQEDKDSCRREDPLALEDPLTLSSDEDDHKATPPSSGDEHETGICYNNEDMPTETLNDLAADLFTQNDPARMQLTEEEHEWAMAIKKAIEGIPDLDNLSDFMYAQIAIVCKDDIDKAMDKAFRHQRHKQENNILDTLDDALRNLPKDPSYISVDFNLRTGAYIIAVDVTGVDMTVWKDPEATRYFNRRMHYGTLIGYPDFAAMRLGSTLLIECEGYQPAGGAMMRLQHFRRICENFHAYPKKLSNVKFFNSPTMCTVMVSIAKGALPKELASKFQIVPKCPLGRLDQAYGLPTPEIAKQRLKERMKSFARMRYENEKSFRLEDKPKSLGGTPATDTPATDPHSAWC